MTYVKIPCVVPGTQQELNVGFFKKRCIPQLVLVLQHFQGETKCQPPGTRWQTKRTGPRAHELEEQPLPHSLDDGQWAEVHLILVYVTHSSLCLEGTMQSLNFAFFIQKVAFDVSYFLGNSVHVWTYLSICWVYFDVMCVNNITFFEARLQEKLYTRHEWRAKRNRIKWTPFLRCLRPKPKSLWCMTKEYEFSKGCNT